MPFVGAETALGCVGGRRVDISPSVARRPKQAGFLEEEISGDILAGFYRPTAADLRIRASENRVTVNRTIRAGFSSKRYRKSTCLVQVQPVNGWIWRSWSSRQNMGCSDKTLNRPSAIRCRIPQWGWGKLVRVVSDLIWQPCAGWRVGETTGFFV
jgi:hypothetical protein